VKPVWTGSQCPMAQHAPSNSRSLTYGHRVSPRVLPCAVVMGLGAQRGNYDAFTPFVDRAW
jgi:hypothetical protein